MKIITGFAFCAALTLAAGPAFAAGKYIAYIGTYTTGPGGRPGSSKGIYGLQEDGKGHFKALGLQAEVADPSFLATDSSHRFLYAATERGRPTGYLNSYAIDPATGALHFLNRVSSSGSSTAHLIVDKTRHWLLVANYGSGSVASFALKPDGSIGEMVDFHQHSGSSVNPHRQMGPHPHEAVLSPDNRFLLVPDLGLDKVFVYALDSATGKLALASTTDARPGFGPRHMLFGRNGKFVYVLGEMGSAVAVMSYDKRTGKLTLVENIDTIPPQLTAENNSAELALSNDGLFLYATNRGHDSVTVFKVNAANGKLTNVQNIPTQGRIPRGMSLDPDGTHLLTGNQDSNTITFFDRDTKTGKLTFASQMTDIPAAVCILFVPLDGAN
jgi:6-phosphogluconolactonase